MTVFDAPKKKTVAWIAGNGLFMLERRFRSALAGFEPALRLVDDVDAALAAHDTAVAVTLLERAERVLDLHRSSPFVAARACAIAGRPRRDSEFMVGGTGIEPVTPTMST